MGGGALVLFVLLSARQTGTAAQGASRIGARDGRGQLAGQWAAIWGKGAGRVLFILYGAGCMLRGGASSVYK